MNKSDYMALHLENFNSFVAFKSFSLSEKILDRMKLYAVLSKSYCLNEMLLKFVFKLINDLNCYKKKGSNFSAKMLIINHFQ